MHSSQRNYLYACVYVSSSEENSAKTKSIALNQEKREEKFMCSITECRMVFVRFYFIRYIMSFFSHFIANIQFSLKIMISSFWLKVFGCSICAELLGFRFSFSRSFTHTHSRGLAHLHCVMPDAECFTTAADHKISAMRACMYECVFIILIIKKKNIVCSPLLLRFA